MDITFLFKDEFVDRVTRTTKFNGDLTITRALYLPYSDRVIVNLSANQWREYLQYGEEALIKGLVDTINHESFHLAFNNLSPATRVTPIQEENMVRKLVARSVSDGMKYAFY